MSRRGNPGTGRKRQKESWAKNTLECSFAVISTLREIKQGLSETIPFETEDSQPQLPTPLTPKSEDSWQIATELLAEMKLSGASVATPHGSGAQNCMA